MEYLPYVVAAYLIAGATVLALIVWALLGRRGARRVLARAERAANRVKEGRVG